MLSLIIGYSGINVSGILMVVGVLHLVESFLILVDRNAMISPVFMEREGDIIGGFVLNRFWPIPFIIFIKGISEL